jgi:hypothetical protein
MRDLGSDAWTVAATSCGIGLMALMGAWLIGNRVADMFLAPPTGPIAAFAFAILSGLAAAAVSSRRLLRTVQKR